MILRIYSYLFLLFLSLPTLAFEIKDKLGSLDLSISDSWKYQPKFLGLTHYFEDSKKNNLSFTFTGISIKNLKSSELSKTQTDFFNEKVKWAQSRGLRIVEQIPYRSVNKSLEMHMIGVKIQQQDQILNDLSFYFSCPTSLIHAKALVDDSVLENVIKVMSNLKCM